jgi:hypothetical protein
MALPFVRTIFPLQCSRMDLLWRRRQNCSSKFRYLCKKIMPVTCQETGILCLLYHVSSTSFSTPVSVKRVYKSLMLCYIRWWRDYLCVIVATFCFHRENRNKLTMPKTLLNMREFSSERCSTRDVSLPGTCFRDTVLPFRRTSCSLHQAYIQVCFRLVNKHKDGPGARVLSLTIS